MRRDPIDADAASAERSGDNRETPPPWFGAAGRHIDAMMVTPVPGQSDAWGPGTDDTLVGDEEVGAPLEGLPPRLDRYVILRRIGGGGMGSVYAAYDDQLDRKVAIKVLREARGGHEAYERLIREAQALARLAHPNVVMVHDVRATEGQVYIAMEFIAGVTLRAWLSAADRSVAEILAHFEQAGRGLEAAHAAALVHRDFKPDNVMVGDDGRVRVLDFGLVRPRSAIAETAQGEEPEAGRVDGTSASGSRLDDVMTLAGTVLGTPAYMAPEQHLGVPADARTDIFAFCVTLYEALYGTRPFVGGSYDELRTSVLHGELDPPPPHSLVPHWVHRILEQGLRTDPDERWRSMTELLAALARDPVARRRRQQRTFGVVALTALFAVVVFFVGGAVKGQWAERQREAAANERWAEASAQIDGYAGRGREADADAVLDGFIADDQNRDTAAHAHAWIARGERLLARGEPRAAMDAFATAYSSAPDRSLEIRTLFAIARIFVARRDFAALAPVVRALEEEGAGVDPEIAEMASRVALHDRRVRDAAAALRAGGEIGAEARPLAAVIEGLTGATPIGAAFDDGVAHDLDGDGREELVLIRHGVPALTIVGEGGAIRGRHHLDPSITWILPLRGRPFFAGYDGAQIWIYELRAGGVRERWRGPAASAPFSGCVGDLDGDGVDEIYLGLAAYRRGLFSLRLADADADAADADAGARPALVPVHAGTDDLNSDVNAIVIDDLDGDGRRELFAAVGPWRAYDLRVFRAGAGDGLDLVDRLDFGDASGITPLRRADGTRVLAVTKGDRHANAIIFPEPPHTGAPAGIYMVAWSGSKLSIVDHVPLPIPLGPRPIVVLPGVRVADVDGDGIDDLILKILRSKDGHTTTTLIGRQDDAGSIEWLTLGASAPIAAVELDQTPGVELVIADAASTGAAWILGLGAGEMPAILSRPRPRTIPPRGMDAALRGVWRRAQRIAEIGFPMVAADAIERTLRDVAAPSLHYRLLLRVAELRASAGDLLRAREILRMMMRDDDLPRDVLLPAAQILSASGDMVAAGEALTRASLREPELEGGPFTVAELRELARRDERTVIAFDEPLDPAWEIRDPVAVHRDSVAGTLELATSAAPHPAVSLPLEWPGGPLVIDVDVDVRSIEYASSLVVTLSGEDGLAVAGVGYGGRGGGGIFHLEGICANPRTRQFDELFPWPFDHVETERRLQLQLAISARTGDYRCLIEADGTFTDYHKDAGPALAPGRYILSIGAVGDNDVGLTRAAIARIVIDGATILEETPSPQALRARLLAEDDAEGALVVEVAGDEPEDRLIEAFALASARRWEEAESALADLWEDAPEAARPILIRWLRARSPTAVVLLQHALATEAYALVSEALEVPIQVHLSDPTVARTLLTILGDLSAIPETAAGRATKVHLLTARGVAYRHLGRPLHARRELQAAVAVADAELGGPAAESLSDLRVAFRALAELTVADAPELARRYVVRLLEIAVERDVTLTALGRSRELRALVEAAPELAAVTSRLPRRRRSAAEPAGPAD